MGAVCAETESREWTSKRGSTLKAVFISLEKGTLKLKTDDGRQLSVPLASLAPEDQMVAEKLDRAQHPLLVVNAAPLDGDPGEIDKRLDQAGAADGWTYDWKELSEPGDPFGLEDAKVAERLKSWGAAASSRTLVFAPPVFTFSDPESLTRIHNQAERLAKIAANEPGFALISLEPFPDDLPGKADAARFDGIVDDFAKALKSWRVLPTRKVCTALSKRFPIWKDGFTSGDDRMLIQLAMLHSAILKQPADLAGIRAGDGEVRRAPGAAALKMPALPRWTTLSDEELAEMSWIIASNL